MNPSLTALTRKTTFLSITLFILCAIWEISNAQRYGHSYWLALKGIFFLPLLPKIWRGERYAYQIFSLLILLYVLEALVRSYSDAAPSSRYFAVVELILSTAIFICVNQFAFKTKPLKGSSEANKETKSRRISSLLYFFIIIFAVNLTLPSTDNPMMGAEDHTYIQFKTILNWLSLGLIMPYIMAIGFYRFRSARGTRHIAKNPNANTNPINNPTNNSINEQQNVNINND